MNKVKGIVIIVVTGIIVIFFRMDSSHPVYWIIGFITFTTIIIIWIKQLIKNKTNNK
jgi:hypothetical protein